MVSLKVKTYFVLIVIVIAGFGLYQYQKPSSNEQVEEGPNPQVEQSKEYKQTLNVVVQTLPAHISDRRNLRITIWSGNKWFIRNRKIEKSPWSIPVPVRSGESVKAEINEYKTEFNSWMLVTCFIHNENGQLLDDESNTVQVTCEAIA